MLLEITDREKMATVLKSALFQLSLVNKLTLDVSDMFQSVVLDLDEENSISNMMNNETWPNAVDATLIAKSDVDKQDRADGIVFLFLNGDVAGKKVLDFGCGEGFVSKAVADSGAVMSVGYDVVRSDAWDTFPAAANLLLTDDFAKVAAAGPYDVVVMYDVLDHAADPIALLRQARGVVAPGGTVQVRCHPWCSRHGGHVYRSLNKAFAHLMMSGDSVAKLSDGQAPVQKVIHPQRTYAGWFSTAGFTATSLDVVTEPVEPFFKMADMPGRLKPLWSKSPLPEYASGKVFPDFPMAQNFLDYVITPTK